MKTIRFNSSKYSSKMSEYEFLSCYEVVDKEDDKNKSEIGGIMTIMALSIMTIAILLIK